MKPRAQKKKTPANPKTRTIGRKGLQENYEYLFMQQPIPMWIYETESLRFLLVNHAAQAKYGYSRDEFLSMTLNDIRPMEDRDRLSSFVQMTHPDLGSAGLWQHRLHDGTLITVEVVSHALTWKNHEARLVAVYDMTEHERSLKDLQQSQARQTAILRYSIDAIITINERGELTEANPAAEALFGWTQEEVRGKTLSDLLIPPEWRKSHEEGLRRFLETQTSKILGHRLEMEALRANGERFPIELTVMAIPEGSKFSFTAFLRDITERKRSEQAILELNRDLENKVQERTLHLEALNQELESFSYSVSHDLRSPLRAIAGFSQALMEDFGNRLDPVAQGYLVRIQAAAGRMALLIDDLLQLARVSKAPLNPEAFDLGELAQSVMAELEESGSGRKITLEVDHPLPVRGDPKLLRVLVFNLLDNARKFTSRNPEARIHVGQSIQDGEPAYHFADNGVGFDMEYANKLFVPFQRLHDSRDFEGTGVGLATVHRIVLRHGGRIWVQSQPGRGTTFYLHLPSGEPAHA